MATTKAMESSPVLLLLATILLAATSVQARRDSLPHPPAPAPAPAPVVSAAAGGQCTQEGVAQLGVCLGLVLGGPGKTSTAAKDMCCRRIRDKPTADAVPCLCSALLPFYVGASADVGNDVNVLLGICNIRPVPSPVCLQA